jgi:uncharacterized protein YndB with AHSA1/START domain
MPTKTPPKPTISDDAVFAKTGKRWAEWFALLDADGARQMTHKEIVALVSGKYGVGPWWQQAVTVAYEQARGLRAKHEMPTGYQVSASRTLAVPAAQVFQAWADARARSRWLPPAGLAPLSARPGQRLSFKWAGDDSHVEVRFTPKGAAKTQVTVEHSRLPSAAAARRQKAFWSAALDALQARLEK